MKKFLFIFIFFTVLSLSLRAQAERLPFVPPGPLILTSVVPEQLDPNYWISKLPEPDKLLKTDKELAQFNEDIHFMIKDCIDIFKMDLAKPGRAIREQIELEYNTLKHRIMWGADDKRVPESIFENDIQPLLQLEKIPTHVRIKWGVAVRAASIRALPSDVKMLEKPQDYEFDQLQFTLIKLWTPVGIYHESSDGKWYYVQAPYARGWVHSSEIALFPSRQALSKILRPSPLPTSGERVKGEGNRKKFWVVTAESVPIFSGPDLQEVNQRPSMGTILPAAGESETTRAVWLPIRTKSGKVRLGKGYLRPQSDLSKGFLPMTQRNIIRQAFKLLGARYGWGGMYNGRDCSAFTHDIFLTFGIDMPRGSKEQAFVGTQLGHFEPYESDEEKTAILHSATPGITLMRMPHHQMLYLGEVGGKFYAIHCTWAERISQTSDEKNRINQVVVSDLSLNGKSYLGSLFDRIISISEIN